MTAKKQYHSLNILKGIAMIMIIIVHNRHFIMKNMDGLRQLINYGQMGVDLFFLISGMALCFSWYHSYHDSWFLSSFRFILRRYLRLAPGYILILALNLFLNILLIDILQYSPGYIMNRDLAGIFSNIFFLHGFLPEYINSVVPSGWYIGSTFILYMLFPVLLRIFEFIHEKGGKKFMILLPGFFWILDFALMKFVVATCGNTFYPSNCSYMFYIFFNHLPVFSLGILLYFQEKEHFSISFPFWLSVFCAFSFTMLSVFLYLKPDTGNFLFVILPFICGISFYWWTVCFLHIENKIAHKKTRKSIILDFLASCGKHSYGMYLMHAFVCWYLIKALTLFLTQKGIIYHDLLLYFILLIPTILLVYYSGCLLDRFLNYIDKFLRK